MQEIQKHNETITDFLTDVSPNVGAPERVVSAAAGGALLAYGIKYGGVGGTLMSVLGGAMLYRGATGHCHIYDATGLNTTGVPEGTRKSPYKKGFLSSRVHITKAVTINRPVSEVYQFWKNFENFPQFMKHVESVTRTGDNTWHWKAKAPLGTTVEWDATVTSDIEDQRIGWQSLEGSDIPNSGVVEFKPKIDRGTEIKVTLTYEAPGGKF
ncbi:MAG TPA: SRPBCC family protein, partial [Pyrinomonadaceae bacterium]|nr:SRPBCC family protein [Pyrinomonadaceae bacterium]